VVDEIVPEPEGGAHRDPDLAAANLGTALRQNLERLSSFSMEELLRNRYDKFRKLGKYTEEVADSVAMRDPDNSPLPHGNGVEG
jgi:acetyl-CoA carboxylase carboxyl transferase subunit alpha